MQKQINYSGTRSFFDWLRFVNQIKLEGNTIPPMTYEYGKYWDQPELSEITIDSKYATMNQDAFLKLHDYSRSQPSGVYEGKMWKSSWFGDGHPDNAKVWYLHWWSSSDEPDKCKGNVREIKIV